MTNIEKIRVMSVEEFARWLCNQFRCETCFYGENLDCMEILKEWLLKEVEE